MTETHPSRTKIILAFLAIYLIWGSTYLAIKVAVTSFPPFFMAGTRFITAFIILGGWAWYQGAKLPTWPQVRSTLVIGLLLLLGGNGAVCWAEQKVDSGFAALIITTTPLFMVLIDRMGPAKKKLHPPVMGGILLGFLGIIFLIGPEKLADYEHLNLTGIVALIFATASWAAGSIYSRHNPLPVNQNLNSALQMLFGGLFLLIFSVLSGEYASASLASVTPEGWLSWAYLVIFGSVIAFSAFVFLLKWSTPAKVSTYAYVNPVVAVLLGYLILGEPLTVNMLIGGGIIVLSVIIITKFKE